jgi:hypothetical protein
MVVIMGKQSMKFALDEEAVAPQASVWCQVKENM